MKKLEIELYQYENLVFGKILYQDESLRDDVKIVEKNGFSIGSFAHPELVENSLYIRGVCEKQDNNVFYYQFCDEETAIKTCEKIKECVDLINGEGKRQSSIERII